MKLMLILLNVFLLIKSLNAGSICYEDYGCFTDEYPYGGSFQRPLGGLPLLPSKINTTFTLYNRNNSDGIKITRDSLEDSFISSIPTKFVTHGFLSERVEQWMLDMISALLDNDDFNVIYVNWVDGSGFPYQDSVANTQIVAIDISKLIQKMISLGALKKDIHLIGHSLGAHISGLAGQRIKIGRITGLDPAGPYFEDTPHYIRLSPDDADFVDVIHTNAMNFPVEIGFGINAPIGDVDFYVNGGTNQPGCSKSNSQFFDTIGNILATFDVDASFKQSIGCSHGASHILFTDSIKNVCSYRAYPCESYEKFANGDCILCSKEKGCNRMGFWALPNINVNQSFYLNTQIIKNDDKCKQNYQIRLTSAYNGKSKKAKGIFEFYFETASGLSSSTETIDDGNTVFESFSVHNFLLSLDKPVKDSRIIKAYLSYKRKLFSLDWFQFESEWEFIDMQIFSGEHQTSVRLCPVERYFTEGFVEYELC